MTSSQETDRAYPNNKPQLPEPAQGSGNRKEYCTEQLKNYHFILTVTPHYVVKTKTA